MSRGLRDYLVQKRAAMRAAAEARPDGAQWRDAVEALVVADDATGVRKLRIRDWTFVSDSGPAFGGWSLGPSSPELLCGVVATCLAHTYEIMAATLEVPLDRVEVRVTANNNDAAFLGLATDDPSLPWGMTAHVSVDAEGVAPERLAELHRVVEQRCPLTAFVRGAQSLRVVV